MFAGGSDGNNISVIFYNADGKIWYYDYIGAAFTTKVETAAVFRDFSAWFHLAVAVDTTQATSSNRVKLYINGSQVTAFSTATYPSLNADTQINTTTVHTVGRESNWYSNYSNFYLADIHFIDGQALTPSSFTEVSATTGQLIPKAYTGSYTGNSFWLKFSDNSAATATTLGKDYSGNSNNWTPNNLSVTAGAGNDSLVDTPTSYGTDTGAGGEVRGNYCTLNPLDNGGLTLANGNLDFSRATASWVSSRSTFGVSSGKWYWEVTLSTGNDCMAGISKNDAALSSYFANVANGWAYNAQNGQKYNNGSGSAYGNSWVGGNDTVGVAFDADAGSIYFYKNGVVQNSGNAAFTGLTSGPYFPSVALYGTSTAFINFGQRPFAYQTPGTNRPAATFLALCDTNLPAPLVAKPETVMDVKLWTGNATARSITGFNFSPDFVWIKNRADSVAGDHRLFDTVRGATKELYSNLTGAEATETGGLTAFNSDGFSLGTINAVNGNADGIVGWCWDAGSSTVTNTQGSITSSVRANASAGFSIVTYTGNSNSSKTIGHGLNAVPSLMIVKCRTAADGWVVYHKDLGNTSTLQLQSTNAVQTSDTTAFASTTPTSTVFTVGNSGRTGDAGRDYVAYLFSPLVGYSSMGSYVANANSDGPFVYTGFKPRFVLCKLSSAAGADWLIFDTARSPYNVVQANLRPNTSSAEESAFARIDILSNGFKLRAGSGVEPNSTNGNTYIYAAWAEFPFQYSRAA